VAPDQTPTSDRRALLAAPADPDDPEDPDDPAEDDPDDDDEYDDPALRTHDHFGNPINRGPGPDPYAPDAPTPSAARSLPEPLPGTPPERIVAAQLAILRHCQDASDLSYYLHHTVACPIKTQEVPRERFFAGLLASAAWAHRHRPFTLARRSCDGAGAEIAAACTTDDGAPASCTFHLVCDRGDAPGLAPRWLTIAINPDTS
jgi:hypothetical protein